ncbi:MAG: type II toxin-antitoxin system mRNA interferase toxin, RelE/StbE family [Chitinophagaceae bacterium]|nr:MAG: type II toxin-antitoxin system mRNA interferase toxin, RelE/StbE family [Chitinophagaceae bacterium]
MRIKNIHYSSKFIRSLKQIPKEIASVLDGRVEILKNDCFDHRLKTHKLKGKFKNIWSFSVTYSYRIVFEFVGENEVLFIEIGNHDIYR